MVNHMKQYNLLSFEEKIDLFETTMLDKNPHLLDMANDIDEDIRIYLASELVNYQSKKSEQLLVKMTSDPSYRVRINACDSLCWCKSTDVLELLFAKAQNDMYLVRGYAVLSISDILIDLYDEIYIEKLKSIYKKEKSAWTRLCYHQALYKLGFQEYLPLLILALKSKRYNYRIAAINMLYEIADKNNKYAIESAFKCCISTEKCISVLKSLKEKIKKLEELN